MTLEKIVKIVILVKGMTPDICFLVFAQVRHVRENFGKRT